MSSKKLTPDVVRKIAEEALQEHVGEMSKEDVENEVRDQFDDLLGSLVLNVAGLENAWGTIRVLHDSPIRDEIEAAALTHAKRIAQQLLEEAGSEAGLLTRKDLAEAMKEYRAAFSERVVYLARSLGREHAVAYVGKILADVIKETQELAADSEEEEDAS